MGSFDRFVSFGLFRLRACQVFAKAVKQNDLHDLLLFEWVATAASPPCPAARSPGPFVYDPHPAIIAGHMVDSLAEFGLQRMAADIACLTGVQIEHGALAAFEVLDCLRLDKRLVESCLKQHHCGQLEVKKRGVDHRLIEKFAATKYNGSESLVLILTRHQEQYVALVCRRAHSRRAN